MKTRKHYLMLAVIIAALLVLLPVGMWSAYFLTEDARTFRELRNMHASLRQYLQSHNFQWPQAAGASAEAKEWWTKFEAQHDTKTYQVTKFDSTPNEAYRYAHTPWVTRTSKEGQKRAIFADGHLLR